MADQSLTDIAVKNVALPMRGQIEIWDARVRGFGLRVSHAGTRAFVLVYRFNGRPRRLTLGRYPTLSLSEARGLANAALRTIALGTDPGAEKVKARHTPSIEQFEAFVTYFIDTYARPKNRSADETAKLLRREFVRAWGNRPIAEISRQDVSGVLDRIMHAGKHTTANRALAAIRKLFNWAVERGFIEKSPCAGIRAPARSVKRDRVLADTELAAIWKATTLMGYPFGTLVQLLILTGQRREEVVGMSWREIDLEHALWSIGAERTKAARAHEVPLPPLAIKILRTLPHLGTDLVVPGRFNTSPVSGFSKWKADLDKLSGVNAWRLHDLRRTVATGMARFGTAPHVVERILNHTSGTFGGVAGVYNRFGYLPEMRAALDRWAEHVATLVGQSRVD